MKAIIALVKRWQWAAVVVPLSVVAALLIITLTSYSLAIHSGPTIIELKPALPTPDPPAQPAPGSSLSRR